MSAPDFICIGAPKGGTTWLFDNLVRHPQVWLPPTKSIQYFTGGVNRRRFRKLLLGIRNQGVNRGNARFSLSDDKEAFAWKLKYYFWPVTNSSWYCSLFPQHENQVGGEIAPSYVSLSMDQVARVKAAAPEAKVIFFMRNPVDRAWSHFMLSYIKTGRKDFENLSSTQMIELLDRPRSLRLSNYPETLRCWRQHFDNEQMLLCYFEEIKDDPDTLMQRICRFLNIEPDSSIFEESSKRNIFKGVKRDMPPEVREHLSRVFYPQLTELANEFAGFPAQWLASADEVLGEKG